MNTVSNLREVDAVREYLSRIGAEPRSLLVAVVKEVAGNYWRDIAVIKFDRDGEVSAPDEYAPTDSEAAKIKDEFSKISFPHVKIIAKMIDPPEELQKANKKDVFVFRNQDGNILMVQLRRDGKEGEKHYIPFTYWSDGKWRKAEPEGKLPLWGLDRLNGQTTVFIHEGAKAARAVSDMVTGKTASAKKMLSEHPWGDDLARAAHVGWIGGALSPARTDWSMLKRAGVTRAYIVSDNDAPGISAVPAISYHLNIATFHVQFTDEFPKSFDLADKFPDKMFSKTNGVNYYIGPSFRSCLHPATWATDLLKNKKGKPTPILRKHFANMWAYVEEADLWVCLDMPEIIHSQAITNKIFAPFSHSARTAELLLKNYRGRTAKICYRPDCEGRIVTDNSTSAINLHVPTQIKPMHGDATIWEEFLHYLFPIEAERKQVERWCATLIARTDVHMKYGLLLVSETQGVGKTTLGADILGRLVGDSNVDFPSERTIVDSAFNDWIANKRLVVVAEIYSGHSWKAYNNMKSYITDKSIKVNVKFEKPYTIENWAHFIAMSNSMRALKVEPGDRRWFSPKVSEIVWPDSKFKELHDWIRSGGLSIIYQWAIDYGDYVSNAERAPMTEMKKEIIEESISEGQREAEQLALAMERIKEPVFVDMKSVEMWIRSQCQRNVFDTSYELKKAMVARGCFSPKKRLTVFGRLQYVVGNSAAQNLILSQGVDVKKAVSDHCKKAGEIIEAQI